MRNTDPGMHWLIVDRFEGEFVVVEMPGGITIDLPRWLLPNGAKEGDVIQVETGLGRDSKGGSVRLTVDREASAASLADSRERLQRLRDRDPGGDIHG
jgi:hypothetical protein